MRDRTILNNGLAELSVILPELDRAERTQLIGALSRALIELVGLTGHFYHVGALGLYKVHLVPVLEQCWSVAGTDVTEEAHGCLSEIMTDTYFVPGCTCRAVTTLPDGTDILAGVDDCPVHGFKDNG